MCADIYVYDSKMGLSFYHSLIKTSHCKKKKNFAKIAKKKMITFCLFYDILITFHTYWAFILSVLNCQLMLIVCFSS